MAPEHRISHWYVHPKPRVFILYLWNFGFNFFKIMGSLFVVVVVDDDDADGGGGGLDDMFVLS